MSTRRVIVAASSSFLLLSITLLSTLLAAAGAPQTYPEEGKVVGIRIGSDGNGASTRKYKVETTTEIFELDCGGGFAGLQRERECGGDKKFQIGDVVRFRVDKKWAFLQIHKGSAEAEQKLRILNRELKPRTAGK